MVLCCTLTMFFIDKTITLLLDAILSGWFFDGSCGFWLDMLIFVAGRLQNENKVHERLNGNEISKNCLKWIWRSVVRCLHSPSEIICCNRFRSFFQNVVSLIFTINVWMQSPFHGLTTRAIARMTTRLLKKWGGEREPLGDSTEKLFDIQPSISPSSFRKTKNFHAQFFKFNLISVVET